MRCHVAEVLFKEQRRRRDRPRLRSHQLAGHLRRPLEHPSSALEHLSAVVRSGERAVQVDGRRRELAAADQRSAGRRPRRIGIAVAPANSRRVYAIVDAKEGGLFRSDDAGGTWSKTSDDSRILGPRLVLRKDRGRPEEPGSRLRLQHRRLSIAGRRTHVRRAVQRIAGRRRLPPALDLPGRWQSHDSRGDQGAVISVDGHADHPTWSSWLNQPTAQIYRLAADNSFPYWVTGAQQDSGAVRVRSRGRFAGITMARLGAGMRRWRGRLHGARPAASGDLFGGTVTRCNVRDRQDRGTSRRKSNLPTPARHTWTVPLVFSPADPRALYFSDQYLFKTTDGGGHWTRISEDMTREIRACRRTSMRRRPPTRRRNRNGSASSTRSPLPQFGRRSSGSAPTTATSM